MSETISGIGLSNIFYRAYTIVELFKNFLEHIFEHIKGPLSGLFFITDKCKTKEIRGGAFSIRRSHGWGDPFHCPVAKTVRHSC